ncbi:MAG: tyrosine-type recombinase/integrase [Sphaerochaetaceae bacterium]|nr:tyrosine-type recombinase/integrase [Sphaerochaetaceae bacterium]
MDTQSQNRAYIDNFLTYLGKVQGYSEKTIISYAHDLMRLEDYLTRYDLRIEDMAFEDARQFTSELYEQELSHATINRILSANRTFFHSLMENSVVKADPFKRVSSAKQSRKIPTVLAKEELDSILNSPITDYSSLMEVTMFHLFYSTGCRLSEIMGMRLQDIDLKNRRIIVTGKGNKQRYVFLTNRAVEMLNTYLPQRQLVIEQNNAKGQEYLLINHKAKQPPLSTIHSIFDKYSARLGLTKKFTPHVFRHTFATNMIDNDSDIRVVQVLLGHESIGTTQIYTHVTGKRLEKVYRESHPHGKK